MFYKLCVTVCIMKEETDTAMIKGSVAKKHWRAHTFLHVPVCVCVCLYS